GHARSPTIDAELAQAPTGGGVPEFDLPIPAGGGQQFSVRTEGYLTGMVGVGTDGPDLLAAAGLPDRARPAQACCGEPLGVGAKSPADHVMLSRQRQHRPVRRLADQGRRVPDPEGVIVADRDQALAVGAERYVVNTVGVAVDGERFLARGRVPEADGP